RPGHPALAESLDLLAEILMAQGRHAAAATALEEAIETRKVAAGDDDFDVADARSRLGACLAAAGRTQEAQAALTDAYETLKNASGPKEALRRAAAKRLVEFLDATNQSAKADPLRALITLRPDAANEA